MIRTRIALTVLTLGSSVISFVAHTLMLRHLGASAALDLLFYAASVPVALAGVTSGVLLYLLPPRFTQIASRVQESTLRVLFACFAVICAVAIIGTLVYGLMQGRSMLAVLWAGFIVVALLTILSTLAACIAQARGAYLATGVAPMITSAGLLGGVLMAIASRAEWWLVIGQLLGTAAAVLWMARSLRLAAVWSGRDVLLARAALGPLKPHALAITMGTMAFTLFQPIDAALCAQLGSGSITVMSYAQRVVVAVSTAVSLGAYAVAARTSHDVLRSGGQRALRRLANREVFRVVSFGMVVWLSYVLGGHALLGALLGSSAMTGHDLARLLDCVQWMLLGAGPMAAIPYLFRVFYSQQAYRKPALLGIGLAPAYGLLAWVLLPFVDILALAYAYACVWWFTLAVALLWLNEAVADVPPQGRARPNRENSATPETAQSDIR